MGMTWRITMPLLSTLAALVIIVHSAEDDVEHDYQYDLRPRVLDTRLDANYEQPWRVAEPLTKEFTEADTWNNEPQEDPPVRRRLGRKRKRRPPADDTDDVTPRDKHTNVEDEPVTHSYDTPSQDNVETPRRRRKKLRPNRWIDEPKDGEVPLRRRLQGRKRPSLNTWPELSEFGYTNGGGKIDKGAVLNNYDAYEDTGVGDLIYKGIEANEEYLDKQIKVNVSRPRPKFNLAERVAESPTVLVKEDKSLSEFSLEVMSSYDKINDGDQYSHNTQVKDEGRDKSKSNTVYKLDKAQEKALLLAYDKYFDFRSEFIPLQGIRNKKKIHYTVKDLIEEIKSLDKFNQSIDLRLVLSEDLRKIDNTLDKCKDKLDRQQRKRAFLKEVLMEMEEIKRDHGPIDAQTLKDILKRSNGTSLSEILQQHNLSLGDLLSGKENALSVLQSEKLLRIESNETASEETDNKSNFKNNNATITTEVILAKEVKNYFENEYAAQKQDVISRDSSITKKDDLSVEGGNTTISEESYNNPNSKNENRVNKVNNQDSLMVPTILRNKSRAENSTIGLLSKRRFSGGNRRKLRMRPMLNTTYKGQLNRDLIALSAKRYVHHNRRNTIKAKEWKDMIPLMPDLNLTDNNARAINESVTTITTSVPEETTTPTALDEIMPSTISYDVDNIDNDADNETTTTNVDEVESTTITFEILEPDIPSNMTETPIVIPIYKEAVNASGLRRQAFNNRLRRKRLKHKTSTTESPDDVMKNFLNMGDYVSSSEFIAKTHIPKFTSPNYNRDTVTELEDFMTTQTTRQTKHELNSITQRSTLKPSTATEHSFTIPTEETAKIEIEEIFNDTRTSTKLSKILRERNMTLSELLDHRERGSSHIHLADIFHNASREPNPPEPFLTKSLLEPISKEIYPLRALLDANSHDTTTKATTVDPNASLTNHVTIPVIMDFGNNVNENAENMGIMSLFNNITNDVEHTEKINLQQDSEGTPYKSTIINVNATDDDNDMRESRMMNDDQDMVSWNEIFTMLRKHNKSETNDLDILDADKDTYSTQKKINLETDVDGDDGVIVLEDLQHLREIDSNAVTSSEEKVDFNSYESSDVPHGHSVMDQIPSSTKSVTVATASIVGLAMILFLLTYAALKWKQQRVVTQKNSYCDERIPTPVFENRKVKKNCSSRSISPMLPTSNIYTMNTLESQNGKESPEYMWDTLRKPFQ